MEAIREIVEKNIVKEQLFLVDVIVSGKNPGQKITVIIDGDGGVTIDDCVALSRAVSLELETLTDLPGPFTLNVSSPGLEHPIKLRRQYQKNIGRKVKVTLSSGGIEEGKLLEVLESDVVIEKSSSNKGEDSLKLEVPFAEIVKTNVLVSFK